MWGEPYHGDLLYASTADGRLYEWRARNPHTSMSPTVPTVVPGIPGAKTREGIGATQRRLARDLKGSPPSCLRRAGSSRSGLMVTYTAGVPVAWAGSGTSGSLRASALRRSDWVWPTSGSGMVGFTQSTVTGQCGLGVEAHGVLGLDSSVSVALPTRIPGLENVLHLSEGRGGVLAVTRDGSVWAWGSNKDGRLGVGDTRPRPRPVRVPGLSNIRTVVRDNGAAWYAIDGSGRLYSWGPNIFGRLGVGDEGERLSPTLVEGVPPVDHMAMLTMWSASAVTTDGELWSWGRLRQVSWVSAAGTNWCSARNGSRACPGLLQRTNTRTCGWR